MYAEIRSEPQVGHWLPGRLERRGRVARVPFSLSQLPRPGPSLSIPASQLGAGSSAARLSSRSLEVRVITGECRRGREETAVLRYLYIRVTRQVRGSEKKREKDIRRKRIC